jgi:3-oxoacyl-[acyl-carrier protein] reductase
VVDVSDEIGVNGLIETVVKTFGQIDVLVNNAGISPKKEGRRPNLIEIGFDEWRRVINVNLNSVYLCCKAVFPHMMKRKYGRIINISSSAALDGGYLAGPHYVASKGGVRALTMNIAREVAGLGITINAIAPGRTLTPMAGLTSNEKNKEALQRIPVGRFAVPEDIANAALFLASDASQYITGTTLNITGGQVLD